MESKITIAAGSASHGALTNMSAQAPSSNRISTECHDSEIPPFAESAMNNLYGSLFSSLARFRVYGGAESASTYVERSGGNISAIFLFRREGKHVRVLNEGMRVDEAALNRFAEYIFGRFGSVETLSFNAVEGGIKRLKFPFQRFGCTEDSVVELPRAPDGYLNNFGKSMKRNIRYYLNRLQRDFPSFAYRVYDKDGAPEEYVRGIIAFNRLRFASKHKTFAIDAAEEARILRMVRECGIVGAATIDGRLCAGSITYRIGDSCFSWIKAHDPTYDDYRFGVLTSYLMIRECIARGARSFHFLWGRQPQKALLQGELREQAHVTIFRSRLRVAMNVRLVARNAIKSLNRNCRLKLKEMEACDGFASNVILPFLKRLASLRP